MIIGRIINVKINHPRWAFTIIGLGTLGLMIMGILGVGPSTVIGVVIAIGCLRIHLRKRKAPKTI